MTTLLLWNRNFLVRRKVRFCTPAPCQMLSTGMALQQDILWLQPVCIWGVHRNIIFQTSTLACPSHAPSYCGGVIWLWDMPVVVTRLLWILGEVMWLVAPLLQVPAGQQSGLWDGSLLCASHCQTEEQKRLTEVASCTRWCNLKGVMQLQKCFVMLVLYLKIKVW